MAAGLSTTVTFNPLHRSFSSSSSVRLHHPRSLTGLPSSLRFRGFSVCYVVEEQRQSSPVDNDERLESTNAIDPELLALRLAEKLERKKSERFTYLIAAVMSSFGITSMAVMAVYYRFSWQMEVITKKIITKTQFNLKKFHNCFFFGYKKWIREVRSQCQRCLVHLHSLLVLL